MGETSKGLTRSPAKASVGSQKLRIRPGKLQGKGELKGRVMSTLGHKDWVCLMRLSLKDVGGDARGGEGDGELRETSPHNRIATAALSPLTPFGNK